MDKTAKTFYVYEKESKSFKKMYFANTSTTGQDSLNESCLTKMTTVDMYDQIQELGEMEFQPITIKLHY